MLEFDPDQKDPEAEPVPVPASIAVGGNTTSPQNNSKEQI